MEKHTTTETRMMEDNNGKPFYIHIVYDEDGNPIRRQVSRMDKASNYKDWCLSLIHI